MPFLSWRFLPGIHRIFSPFPPFALFRDEAICGQNDSVNNERNVETFSYYCSSGCLSDFVMNPHDSDLLPWCFLLVRFTTVLKITIQQLNGNETARNQIKRKKKLKTKHKQKLYVTVCLRFLQHGWRISHCTCFLTVYSVEKTKNSIFVFVSSWSTRNRVFSHSVPFASKLQELIEEMRREKWKSLKKIQRSIKIHFFLLIIDTLLLYVSIKNNIW